MVHGNVDLEDCHCFLTSSLEVSSEQLVEEDNHAQESDGLEKKSEEVSLSLSYLGSDLPVLKTLVAGCFASSSSITSNSFDSRMLFCSTSLCIAW